MFFPPRTSLRKGNLVNQSGTSPAISTGVLYVIKHRLLVYKKVRRLSIPLSDDDGDSKQNNGERPPHDGPNRLLFADAAGV